MCAVQHCYGNLPLPRHPAPGSIEQYQFSGRYASLTYH